MITLLMALTAVAIGPQEQPWDIPPVVKSKEPLWLKPRITFWQPEIHGGVAPDQVKGVNLPAEGSRVSLDDDLGLEAGDTVPILELEFFGKAKDLSDKPASLFTWGGAKLSYWRHSWTTSTSLRSDLTIDGELFPEGTATDQRLTVHHFGLDAVGGGVAVPDSLVGLEMVLGLRFIRVEYDFESPAGDLEDAEGGLGINLGLGVGISPFPWCYAAGRVSYAGLLGIPIREASTFVGVELGPLRVEGGYRGLWSDMHASSQFMDLSMEGPFLALEIRF